MTALTDYPASKIFFSQRLRLHYVDWGNPTAPPLILVHGGRDHCRSWDWVALALKERYRIIAPDLRGHGDSDWVNGAGYAMIDYVYDLAQLIRQQHLAPVTLLGHSLGGRICLEYAGIYPERVHKLIAIEGLGPSRRHTDQHSATAAPQRMQEWISERHRFAGRLPRRYPTLADAVERMREANPRLSEEQAQHLTTHAVHQNEDGSFVWKFDNYARGNSPYPFNEADADAIWSRVTMPTLLLSGLESYGDPNEDERSHAFPNARKIGVAEAGHWVHHDQLEVLLEHVNQFLSK